jgi:hypothetical protein
LRARLVHRSRTWRNLGLGGAVLTGALAIGSVPTENEEMLLMAFYVACFLVVPVGGYFGNVGLTREEADVDVENGTLTIRGERIAGVPRASRVTQTPRGDWRVEISRARRSKIMIEVDSAEDARALLASLGLDRREGTTRFRVRQHPSGHATGLYGALILGFFGLCLLGVSFIAAAAFVVAALAVPAVSHFVWSIELTIGADAVAIHSGVVKRVIPHASIKRILRLDPVGGEIVSPGVLIETTEGFSYAFDTRAIRFRGGVWQTDPVFDALHSAWSRASRAAAAASASLTLARGGRSTREWIAALREYVHNAPNYRVAPLEANDLHALALDATADPEIRAAALVALSANPEHAPRLRVAADEIADPVLRRIALAPPEDLEPALESLDKMKAAR